MSEILIGQAERDMLAGFSVVGGRTGHKHPYRAFGAELVHQIRERYDAPLIKQVVAIAMDATGSGEGSVRCWTGGLFLPRLAVFAALVERLNLDAPALLAAINEGAGE